MWFNLHRKALPLPSGGVAVCSAAEVAVEGSSSSSAAAVSKLLPTQDDVIAQLARMVVSKDTQVCGALSSMSM